MISWDKAVLVALLLGAHWSPIGRTFMLAGSFAPCSQNGKFGGRLACVAGSEERGFRTDDL